MNRFIIKHIIQPLAGKWFKGLCLLLLWTVAFIALPAISGWFLAACSAAFIAANTLFAYLIPSAIIRLLALVRTITRYFERLENHKTTLNAQRGLQLKIFQSVARLPYFNKQANHNSTLLENSTHGLDQILNHILLWLLPLTALVTSILLYSFFTAAFSGAMAIEFLVSSAILLFIIPRLFFIKNKQQYNSLKTLREENNRALIESFNGRIEIWKYNLQAKATNQYEQRLQQLERPENSLQINSYNLQLIAGLGFSYIATFLIWSASTHEVTAQVAIGIFFGIMAQAELAEVLFAGKSERNTVAAHINDLDTLLKPSEQPTETVQVNNELSCLRIDQFSAKIPETFIQTNPLSLNIKRGEWVALYGETGKGKTTLLNGLFYPEYRQGGALIWNNDVRLTHLPVPQCIYVAQKAYLLTGTLRENFEGHPDEAIDEVLKIVDLHAWRLSLTNGMDTWLGENGETLSGGQRKKLLLAQALLKRPQLLVVDEPTAGINTENAIAIFKNIKHHYPDMAIIMATHQKSFECVAHKVVKI